MGRGHDISLVASKVFTEFQQKSRIALMGLLVDRLLLRTSTVPERFQLPGQELEISTNFVDNGHARAELLDPRGVYGTEKFIV